ncbi:MAG TPA: hypothetical protein VD968_09850, partial [Pyrinomonadaceae bacterium]|nr:hypothetical protein [Pyrinomonadaceae bacterium]
MKTKILSLFALATAALGFSLTAAQTGKPQGAAADVKTSALELPAETRLRNVRQLTFGGENAEAYFSGDGRRLIFQSKREGRACDQIYTMRSDDGSDLRMVSTGAGATTCSYYFPDGKKILYASTHLASRECPPP